MTDVMLQIGASKLAISIGLAGLAWVASRRLGKPSLAHGLWLLPLAVLLVPPFVSIPVWSGGVDPAGPVAGIGVLEAESAPSAGATLLAWLRDGGKEGLVWLWLLGTASVLGWTLVRTLRFHRSLLSASEPAPSEVQRLAREIARRLGLGAAPAVYATRAQLSPMVWWAGGKVRVLVPSKLLAELDGSELRCVLAHELAHVRRRDHAVRWLEWLACAAFWWNPVAWWARRRLRASEELCCDALAVTAIEAEPRTYAGALLRVIDFISKTPVPGPLTFASTIDRCGRASRLERRFRVIMTNRTSTPTPRWLRVALRCGAVCLLAGGLVYCTDQSDLTSVDPAVVPVEKESILHLDGQGDDPVGDAPLRPQVMRKLIEAIATEHALPADLARNLRAAGETALSGGSVRLRGDGGRVEGLRGRTPDMFLAVTPDDGAGDFKTVVFDLARFRSALSEGPLSEEALAAELARHLRVSRNNPNMSLLKGVHVECTGAEAAVLDSSYESQIASMTMTCETAKTSTPGFSMKGVVKRN
ncbi:M56 family metallopeptidase [Candidatus Palauibacter soopunensis]|uniref:M56 family metallopeptidase n=1 Tax=Candidatus Palauibacter soopunensis TaxID=3056739 RepID=UPI00238C5DD0|nr:M56 family metallopeptidase [Candidatus Palauibacter soopunensis]MDE2877427.1 M56 family metallopeptidase [Candidatus Palauibacter soopunensis]